MSLSISEKSFALSQVTINGAGSTFVFPLMNSWDVGYQLNPSTDIHYQSIGSGGGVKEFTAKTILVPLTLHSIPRNDKQLQALSKFLKQ